MNTEYRHMNTEYMSIFCGMNIGTSYPCRICNYVFYLKHNLLRFVNATCVLLTHVLLTSVITCIMTTLQL